MCSVDLRPEVQLHLIAQETVEFFIIIGPYIVILLRKEIVWRLDIANTERLYCHKIKNNCQLFNSSIVITLILMVY